tara:strand:- start:228694 stop:228873 length:180 start_codon:yes stop_codon:yes gene_type:complete
MKPFDLPPAFIHVRKIVIVPTIIKCEADKFFSSDGLRRDFLLQQVHQALSWQYLIPSGG